MSVTNRIFQKMRGIASVGISLTLASTMLVPSGAFAAADSNGAGIDEPVLEGGAIYPSTQTTNGVITSSDLKKAEQKVSDAQKEVERTSNACDQALQDALDAENAVNDAQKNADDVLSKAEEAIGKEKTDTSNAKSQAEQEASTAQGEYNVAKSAADAAKSAYDAAVSEENAAKSAYEQLGGDTVINSDPALSAIDSAQQNVNKAQEDLDAAVEDWRQKDSTKNELQEKYNAAYDAYYKDDPLFARDQEDPGAINTSWYKDECYGYDVSVRDFYSSVGSETCVDWLTNCQAEGNLRANYTHIDKNGDATNVDSVLEAIKYLEQVNELRASLGLSELMITDYQMVVAQISANYAGATHQHSLLGTENFTCGFLNPLSKWYDEEKAVWEKLLTDNGYDAKTSPFDSRGQFTSFAKTHYSEVSHYINLINPNYRYFGLGVSASYSYTVSLIFTDVLPVTNSGDNASRTAYTVSEWKTRYMSWFTNQVDKYAGLFNYNESNYASGESIPDYSNITLKQLRSLGTELNKAREAEAAARSVVLSSKDALDEAQNTLDEVKKNSSSSAINQSLIAAKARYDAAKTATANALSAYNTKASVLNSKQTALTAANTKLTTATAAYIKAQNLTYDKIASGAISYSDVPTNAYVAVSASERAKTELSAKQTTLNEAKTALIEARAAFLNAQSALTEATSEYEQMKENWNGVVDVNDCRFLVVFARDEVNRYYSVNKIYAIFDGKAFPDDYYSYKLYSDSNCTKEINPLKIEKITTVYFKFTGDGTHLVGDHTQSSNLAAFPGFEEEEIPNNNENSGSGNNSSDNNSSSNNVSTSNPGNGNQNNNGSNSSSSGSSSSGSNGVSKPSSGMTTSSSDGESLSQLGESGGNGGGGGSADNASGKELPTSNNSSSRPKATKVKKLTKGKKSFKVKWAKVTSKVKGTRITGYQVRYSTKASMKSAKRKTIKGYKKTSVKISKLKARTKYYVQVRTYMKVNGKTWYSKWSSKKSIKTK